MWFCKDKKLCFTFVPKTGSESLRKTLIGLNVFSFLPDEAELTDNDNALHLKPKEAFIRYPNFKDYTIYGVYRDPLSRFLSALHFIVRSRRFYKRAPRPPGQLAVFVTDPPALSPPQQSALSGPNPSGLPLPMFLLQAAFPEEFKIIRTDFFKISQTEQDAVIAEVLSCDDLTCFLQKQVEWLDVPNIQVIDYNDYENGVLNALKDIEGEKKMYWENVHKGSVLTLSDKSIQLVKEYYKEDYEFGRDKGLVI